MAAQALRHAGTRCIPRVAGGIRPARRNRGGLPGRSRTTDLEQAVSREPHRDNPELDVMRFSTMKALEITEDSYRSMTRGQLEARILDGDRAQARAPADVSSQLRITARAEADAWQQSANAEAAHDQPATAAAKALANHMTAEKTRLEALSTAYETWAGKTQSIREAAGKAKAELGRRGQPQPQERPQTMAGWAVARRRPRRHRPRHRPRAPGCDRRGQVLATGKDRTGGERTPRGRRGRRAAAPRRDPSGTRLRSSDFRT